MLWVTSSAYGEGWLSLLFQHLLPHQHADLSWKQVAQLNQSILKEINWIFTGRTEDEAETPVLWPPDAKSQLTGKDPDAGKD